MKGPKLLASGLNPPPDETDLPFTQFGEVRIR